MPKASVQGNESAQKGGEAFSEFAQLIQQIANEPVPETPAMGTKGLLPRIQPDGPPQQKSLPVGDALPASPAPIKPSLPLPVAQPPSMMASALRAPAGLKNSPPRTQSAVATQQNPLAAAPIKTVLASFTAQAGEEESELPQPLTPPAASASTLPVPSIAGSGSSRVKAHPSFATDETLAEPLSGKEEEQKPLHAASGTTVREQRPAPAGATENPAGPGVVVAVPVPVPAPIKLGLPSFAAQPDESTQARALPTAPARREQAPDLRPVAALELKIRTQDQPAEAPVEQTPQRAVPASKPAPPDDRAADAAPEVSLAGPAGLAGKSRAEQITHAAASLPVESLPQSAAVLPAPASPVVAAATPQVPLTNLSSGAKPEPQASPAAHIEEPLPDAPKEQAQPLRSLSIEFTPDGAQDVHLRLAERAGDVHISLHSTDPVLTGRLSDGVHDLVGTLANAGYDAQAWTPNQGRQNQRQSEDPRRNRRGDPAEAGTEEFGAIMQQPIESNP